MALNAKNAPGGGSPMNYEPMLGTYPARLVGVIDLGLQAQRPYLGQEKKPAREMMLTYEFVDEFMTDEDGQELPDKPRWLSERFPLYNLSADKARSTLRYLSIDPKEEADGDWTQLLGTPVLVTVVQNPGKGKNTGKVFENIENVAAMREKDVDKTPELINDPVVFDLDKPDMDMWKLIPEWTQKIIRENLEYAGSNLAALLHDDAAPPPAKEEEVADTEDEMPY